MHSALLGTAGYTLLVSSLFSLFYVLRKKVKSFEISSLHTFAVSDILSSLITGVLLIFNQYLTIGGPIEQKNSSSNRTYTEFFSETRNSGRFSVENLIEANESTSACQFRDVVAHYAMFIFPFVNAFVSLLSFSARTCIDLDHVVGECGKMIETSKDSGRGNISKFKNEKLMTGLGLAGQWIVPILLTAVFNFAGNEDMENLKNSRDLGCIYGMNFPFENCYASADSVDSVEKYLNQSSYVLSVLNNNYIAAIDSSEFQANDSIETDEKFGEIVSKIYDIVESAKTRNVTEQSKPTNFYEIIHLTNITKFVDKNGQVILHGQEKIQNQTKNHGHEIFNEEKVANGTLEIQEELFYNETTESLADFYSDEQTNVSKISNEDFDAEEESKLFESLLANSSESLVQEKTPEGPVEQEEKIFNSWNNNSTYENGSELENVKTGISHATDDSKEAIETPISVQSDKEIYADIVKKIQAVAMRLRRRKNVEFLKEKNEPRQSQKDSNNNIISRRNEREENEKMPACMKNQCFVSPSFLKIHLLVLVFLVYFVPIFTSAVLQTRAKYACRSIKEKLAAEEAAKKNPTLPQCPEIATSKIMENVASTSSWFPPETKFEVDFGNTSFEGLVIAEKSESISDKLHEQREKRINQEKKSLETMKNDVRSMEKLLQLFQTNFLLAVLSWTPIFLELLTKVFLCMSTVEWLFDVSFLAALLFGIARNILNFRMISIHKVIRNDCIKGNSVLPSS